MLLNRPLLALDIGSSSVKIIELSIGSERHLKTCDLMLLPPGAVVDGLIQDIPTVERVVKEIVKKNKISTRGRRAVVSLNGSSVIIKKIMIPKKEDANLAEQVFYEAEQHFQHDMSDLYFDFYEISKEPNGNGEVPVVIVGAKREIVEQQISVVRSVGMRTGVVDCDIFAIVNMFQHNYGDVNHLVALVNIGASAIQVSLVGNGQYLYTREIPMGGNDYTKKLMEVLNIDYAKAESLKISATASGQSCPEQVLGAINQINATIINEIQVTVDYFLQSGEAPPEMNSVAFLFLSGGASKTLGLDAALAAAMQIPVYFANPFLKIGLKSKKYLMEEIISQGQFYTVAIGLAMRNIKDN